MRFFVRATAYFFKDWALVGVFLALVGLSIAIGVMQAWPMAVLVDVVLNPSPTHYGWPHRLFLFALPHNRLSQIIGVTFIGMMMKIGQDSIGAIKILISKRFTYHGRFRVRCELYDKLQHQSIAYHRSLPQGDAIYRVLNDAIGCEQILNVLLNSSIAAVTLLVMVAIMLSRNIPLTFFALSVAPLLIITNNYFGKRIKHASIAMKEVDTHLTTLVQRGMTAVGLVQAFNRQKNDFRHFKVAADASADTNYDLDWYNAMFGFAICTIYSLGGAIIFGYGGYLVYRDQFLHPVNGGVSCGDLMVFMAYLGSLWEPLRTLASTKADLQTGVAGAERVFQVLDEDLGITDPAGSAHEFALKPRELSLNNVSFKYQKGTPVLADVSARISPGQMVGFIGPSGAGKTTLLQLIPRFYDVCAGSVKLDGTDIRNLSLADLRKHIALVPQDSVLLPTTIAENIAYGRPQATAEEIREAAEAAGAHEFISEFPRGYQTPLLEGGQNLSGGQRQRIAIARAILSAAPILVLDEPTSALDPHNTQQIVRTLHQLRRHRTVILVTHHVVSVAGCDQIFVLNHGRIVEQGTHQELLEKDGLYVELLRAEPEPPEPSPFLHEAA